MADNNSGTQDNPQEAEAYLPLTGVDAMETESNDPEADDEEDADDDTEVEPEADTAIRL